MQDTHLKSVSDSAADSQARGDVKFNPYTPGSAAHGAYEEGWARPPVDQAVLETLPRQVVAHVRFLLDKLVQHEQALQGVQRARGNGHILSLELADRLPAIEKLQAQLHEFRAMAVNNQVDPAAVIQALGGEPAFEAYGQQREAQAFAIELAGPPKTTWLGLPSDEDDLTDKPVLETDPDLAVRFASTEEAAAGLAEARRQYPGYADSFKVQPASLRSELVATTELPAASSEPVVQKLQLYVISGRVPGDDDDSVELIVAANESEAQRRFEVSMTDHLAAEEITDLQQRHGTACYVITSRLVGDYADGGNLRLSPELAVDMPATPDWKAIARDLCGAAGAMETQIEQMKDMFPDEDGTIEEALSAGAEACQAYFNALRLEKAVGQSTDQAATSNDDVDDRHSPRP